MRKKAKIRQIVGQTLNLFDDIQTLRIQYFQTVWKSMKFNDSSISFHENITVTVAPSMIEMCKQKCSHSK